MSDTRAPALLTDLYQLTMLQAYFREGMAAPAVFELFVRRLPPRRNFLVAAGLAQVVEQLEALAPGPEELRFLAATGRFDADFLGWLAGLRFTGDVDALPEGTIFFPEEPVIRVVAPIAEAQLVETRLINLVHLQTVIASKAARVVLAARGRELVEFGLRRAHGAEAGLLGARATFLAGFAGTSNVLAGMRFGIPVSGTMAHSYVQAHDDERAAFLAFARANPGATTFLVDTYDTEAGAAEVARLAPALAAEGIGVAGVRLDSGDLAAHARRVRRILDEAGLGEARIFASGNLDEEAVAHLVEVGAPIDAFGVGTRVSTAADAPSLDCAYKLQEYAGRPRRKRSEAKATWPGRKQVWRRRDAYGRWAGDVVSLADDDQPGEPLLVAVLRAGRLVARPSLEEARRRCAAQLAELPAHLRTRATAMPPYPVQIAPALRRLVALLDAERGTPLAEPEDKRVSP